MSGVQGVTWSQFDDDPEAQRIIERWAQANSYLNTAHTRIGKAILATKPAPPTPPRVLQVGDVLEGGWKVIGLAESPRGWVATSWDGDGADTFTQRGFPNGLYLDDGTFVRWPDGGVA